MQGRHLDFDTKKKNTARINKEGCKTKFNLGSCEKKYGKKQDKFHKSLYYKIDIKNNSTKNSIKKK